MNDPVPSFPHFRKLALADRELFETYFSEHPPETSEYTFTNFYIWRNCDMSQVTSVNGNICVVAKTANEPPYFFEPLGSHRMESTAMTCLSHIPRFSRVSEKFAKAHFEGKSAFKIEPVRDNFDYLYEREGLVMLKGKRYDGKRNRIRRFLKHNIPIYQELTEDLIPDCLKLLNNWGKRKIAGACFDEPIKEALSDLSGLNVKGAVIKVNGKVEAFTIGENLNSDTAVIYIEVANPDIDGLSQYINQQFCRNEWDGVTYVNREQDMGDAGLRRAKLSYHPFKMINKYDVTIVDEHKL
ncbi:MAG: phosphatidylglycerol lysyltransferase domain-containing protein [bacterium]